MRFRIILFIIILFSLVFVGNQRQAHADTVDLSGLADRIICKVFTNLNEVGDPFPHLDVDDNCGGAPPPPPQCSDGADNDGDGLVDSADPGCSDSSDNDEANPPPPAACSDGLDNDVDGFIDGNDPNCHTDGNPTNSESYNSGGVESGSLPACWNNIDDDGDGFKDFPNDTGCSSPLDSDESNPSNPPSGTENTLASCSDTIDNDGDSQIDINDSDCTNFKPKIVVLKIVVNDNGGTGTISSFSLHVATSGPGMAESIGLSSGVTTTLSFAGLWKVGEAANSNYTASFSGDCSASGEVSIGIGEIKTCVLTNNDIAPQAPACADGVDNDGDGLIDSADPGCANSLDNDELNSNGSNGSSDNNSAGNNNNSNPPNNAGGSSGSSGSGGGGGGGNGPTIGSYGVIDGTAGGMVLGASTSTIATTTLSSSGESCDKFITASIREGRDNDIEQVKRLQMILRDIEGANIEISGVYDAATVAAVHAFQSKYVADILAPWGTQKSTGYVYITTRRKLNEIYCSKTQEFPLSPQEVQEIVRVRELVLRNSTSAVEESSSEIYVELEQKKTTPIQPTLNETVVNQPATSSPLQSTSTRQFRDSTNRFINYFKKILPNR